MLPWVWEVLSALYSKYNIFKKCYSDFILTQGSVIFSPFHLKATRFDSNEAFNTGNLNCFSVDGLPGQGLIGTRPNTMALRAPFATGSSPSNETFWLCLPTLLLGNPWVACSYSVVFSFSLSLPLSLALLLEAHQYLSAEEKKPTTTLKG